MKLLQRLEQLEQTQEAQIVKQVKYFSQSLDNPNHWYEWTGASTGEPLTLEQVKAAQADFFVIQVCYR